MNISKIQRNDYLIFAFFSSILVFSGWIAYLSALGGFFYSWFILGFFLLMLAALFWQIITKKITFKISLEFSVVFSIILIFVIISSIFVTPTVFSGRDQGSFSESAIRLSQNHQLEFSTPASDQFFKIYGAGKALNFPGFYYTGEGKLITQFPIAYISWLSSFYSFFGLNGLIIANALLLLVFLISFYLLARLFMNIKYAVILLALTATSFPFFWFFKFTLSENMALALLWLSILWIFIFLKEKSSFYYFSFLAPAGLLVFTRIEGILFLISSFLVIFFLTRKDPLWKERKKVLLILPIALFSLIFILNFFKDIHFYQEIAKAVLHLGENGNGTYSIFQKIFSPIIFEAKIFLLYGMLAFMLLGIFGIIYFWAKKEFRLLIPFFVVFPSFIYLINSLISEDHPWMLRRFVFSILPAFMFYSVLFIKNWGEKKEFPLRKIICWLAFLPIFSLNIFLMFNYFTFSENRNLLKETRSVSEEFSRQDLILVDRLASGDGWAMISGPLSFFYQKSSAYIFNPEDIKKIDRDNFNKIYLIVPNQNVETYLKTIGEKNMLPIKDYSLAVEKLISFNVKNEFPSLPEKEKINIQGKIFEIK